MFWLLKKTLSTAFWDSCFILHEKKYPKYPSSDFQKIDQFLLVEVQGRLYNECVDKCIDELFFKCHTKLYRRRD